MYSARDTGRFLRYWVACSILLLSATLSEARDDKWKAQAELWKNNQNRSLILFLDGTQNDINSNTNVGILYKLAYEYGNYKPNIVYYDKGVGTTGASLFPGSITGRGLGKNIRQAYRMISKTYKRGDHIFLIGFSRGAFTARSLSGMIQLCGLLDGREMKDSDVERWVSKLYKAYHRSSEEKIGVKMSSLREKAKKCGLVFHEPVTVEAIFVWDTVAALGNRQIENPKKHHATKLYANRGYHALAIDERRKCYAPVLFSNEAVNSELHQVWFSGNHSDVGGGYDDSNGLHGVSLNWMVENMRDDQIIPPNMRFPANPLGKIHDESTKPLWFFLCKEKRKISEGSCIHESVYERAREQKQ